MHAIKLQNQFVSASKALVVSILTACFFTCSIAAAEGPSEILVIIADGKETPVTANAVRRLQDYNPFAVVAVTGERHRSLTWRSLVVRLGVNQSPKLASAREDSYVLETVSTDPLTVLASGTNERGMLYAAYRLADMLKAGEDLTNLNLFFQPKVPLRYLLFGATTHGRRYYRPELHWKTLNELPRYGYNGVILYPGGGTPIGRRASPIVEAQGGTLSVEPENTAQWKEWIAKIKSYGQDVMMTIPPIIPPGYQTKRVQEFYDGGREPTDYLVNLKSHFRTYLQLLTSEYPEVDLYMFNSTEGATFGRNMRFFGHVGSYPAEDYLRNNEAIMKSYFDVLTEFFGDDLDKVCFWTHSYGLTTEGLRKMREVLFQYPRVTTLEDDVWNNRLWPLDLPAMLYLPEDLRKQVSVRNPFGLFQISTDGEATGGGSLPNAYPGSHIGTSRDALARNARMVIQRMDLHCHTPWGTAFGTMEIIPFAASKQLWDPTPAEPEVWKEWANRRFGKAAAPFVINALQESKTILQKGLTCYGVMLTGGGAGAEFRPDLWMPSGENYKLFSKPGELIVNKTEGDVVLSSEYGAYQTKARSISIAQFHQNQKQAMDAVLRGLEQIEKAKPYLVKTDYDMLNMIYRDGQDYLRAIQLVGRAAYAMNILHSNFDNVSDPKALAAKSFNELREFVNQKKLKPEATGNLLQILEKYQQMASQAGKKADD